MGWIFPLCIAFGIGRDFAWLTFQIAQGDASSPSWHAFELMPTLFNVSMVWLAAAVTGWTIFLTRRA